MSEEKKNGAAVTKPAANIRDLIESPLFKTQVAKALPKHLTPDRFIRIAITALTRTPKLAQCTQASLFQALLTLSQLGIEPDGRRAHLIPYGRECQLIIDYKGLVELVMRTGLVANIHADVICEKDQFEYDRGSISVHKIDFKAPRGKIYAVYAICRFKDGTEKTEVMTLEEIERIRARSPAGKSGPWMTDWSEMAKKTVFRRLSKWLTISPEYRDAIDIDDRTSGLDLEPQRIPIEMPKEITEAPPAETETLGAPSQNQTNDDSLRLDTIQAIRDALMDAHVSEGRFVTYLRKTGVIEQFKGLDDMPMDQAGPILKTMDVALAEIKEAKKNAE